MTVDDSIAKWLLGFLGGAIATTLAATYRLGQQSKTFDEALENVERLTLLVDGDVKETESELKRNGLVGRLLILEGAIKGLAKNSAMVRSILRGMGIPSDLSDDRELQALVKERISQTRIDHTAARLELVGQSDRMPTGGWPTQHLEPLPPPALRRSPTSPMIRREDPPSEPPPRKGHR